MFNTWRTSLGSGPSFSVQLSLLKPVPGPTPLVPTKLPSAYDTRNCVRCDSRFSARTSTPWYRDRPDVLLNRIGPFEHTAETSSRWASPEHFGITGPPALSNRL